MKNMAINMIHTIIYMLLDLNVLLLNINMEIKEVSVVIHHTQQLVILTHLIVETRGLIKIMNQSLQ